MIFREYLLPHLDIRGSGRSTPRLMVAKRKAPMHMVWELRFVEDGGRVVLAPNDQVWLTHEDAIDVVRALEEEQPATLQDAAWILDDLGYRAGTYTGR
ncbi:hypothetical protein [Actinoplanes sp. NPDC051494]|uniref:hypothetical protein n=1 Tax=Actinoplanes sp. NPDC051494 TaxID=3363907 RepID=UPI0037AD7FF8